MKIVIVTGMSGAGKSLVANFLEDLGFFCVDNLPPSLLPKFVEMCYQSRGKTENIALVMDIRGGEFLEELLPGLDTMREGGFSYQVLFLEASDKALIKRYKESRRSHPLAKEGRLLTAIAAERRMLESIKKHANHIIDTSDMSAANLKSEISRLVAGGEAIFKGIVVNIISFGFKYGVPIDCDLVFDVRFLPNPFYIDNLKRHTGLHESVKDYVLGMEEATEFMNKLTDMLVFLIPCYIREGKSSLVIGIGCTGGRHRSVAIAGKLEAEMEKSGYSVVVEHRDIYKDNYKRQS